MGRVCTPEEKDFSAADTCVTHCSSAQSLEQGRGEQMRMGSCACTNIEWGTLRQMAAVEPTARRRAMLIRRVVVVVVVGSEAIARTFEKA